MKTAPAAFLLIFSWASGACGKSDSSGDTSAAPAKPPDPTVLTRILDAVKELESPDRGLLVVRGLAEPGVNVVSEQCAAKLYAALGSEGAEQEKLIAEAFNGSCTSKCIEAAASKVGGLPPDKVMREQREACDPIPVFGRADLVYLRDAMPDAPSLASWFLLEAALIATEGTDLKLRFSRILTDVAVALAGERSPVSDATQTTVTASPNLNRRETEAVVDIMLGECGEGLARVVVDPRGMVVRFRASTVGDQACLNRFLDGATFPVPQDGFGLVDIVWKGRRSP